MYSISLGVKTESVGWVSDMMRVIGGEKRLVLEDVSCGVIHGGKQSGIPCCDEVLDSKATELLSWFVSSEWSVVMVKENEESREGNG